MTPAAVFWENGKRYDVDKVVNERMRPPDHVGGILTRRYDVLIGGKEKKLYLETSTNKWFVEKPQYI